MQEKQLVSRLLNFIKSILTILVLTAFVLLVCKPLIDFNMMYPEQPIMYLINQQIHSVWDLLNVYLHPQMLTTTIPFFRPSGHFLIYQVLYQFIDPHNFKILTIINLIFLALCGFLITKIYPLLFPGFKMGGYIAFAIYLMHPALILSRMISLHFEFAYIFFSLLSLYCFIRYVNAIKYPFLLLLSVIFYILATTFKEPALLLGPSLALYFIIFNYNGQGVIKYSLSLISQNQSRNIIFLLGMVSLTLMIYLTLPWPTMANPMRPSNLSFDGWYSITQLFYYMFNLDFAREIPFDSDQFFRSVVFPLSATVVLWMSIVASAAMAIIIRKDHTIEINTAIKSILYFLLSSLLFLILPILWGKAFGWHYSMTILMLSFIAGFSFEYLSLQFLSAKLRQELFCGLCALIFSMQAYWINAAIIKTYSDNFTFSLNFKILSNAIKAPPDIRGKLNQDSILVIQDAILKDPYITSGGQLYPLIAFENLRTDITASYDQLIWTYGNTFFKTHHIYSGTLFKLAYMMPNLSEMSYPFNVDEMNEVSSFMIYFWLLEFDHVICIGYDASGDWHDLTGQFKKNLLQEKFRRMIDVRSYKSSSFITLTGLTLNHMSLPYPDNRICQFECDQNPLCKGFTYKNYKAYGKRVTKCDFYQAIDENPEPCLTCTSYIKN